MLTSRSAVPQLSDRSFLKLLIYLLLVIDFTCMYALIKLIIIVLTYVSLFAFLGETSKQVPHKWQVAEVPHLGQKHTTQGKENKFKRKINTRR